MNVIKEIIEKIRVYRQHWYNYSCTQFQSEFSSCERCYPKIFQTKCWVISGIFAVRWGNLILFLLAWHNQTNLIPRRSFASS